MPRPSELTTAQRRLEAEKLRARFRESDRRAMHLLADQVAIDEATDDELKTMLPPDDAEYIIDSRRRSADAAKEQIDQWLAWLPNEVPVAPPIRRQLPATARADSGGFAIGGRELFRVLDDLRLFAVWIEREELALTLLVETASSAARAEALVISDDEEVVSLEDMDLQRDTEGIIRVPLAPLTNTLRKDLVIAIRFTSTVESGSIVITWER